MCVKSVRIGLRHSGGARKSLCVGPVGDRLSHHAVCVHGEGPSTHSPGRTQSMLEIDEKTMRLFYIRGETQVFGRQGILATCIVLLFQELDFRRVVFLLPFLSLRHRVAVLIIYP